MQFVKSEKSRLAILIHQKNVMYLLGTAFVEIVVN